MLVLYGHGPNSLRPPRSQTGKRGKKCQKPSCQYKFVIEIHRQKTSIVFPQPFSKTIGLSDEIPKNLKHKVSQGLDPGDDDSLGFHGLQGLPLLCIWFPESAGELI